MECIQLKMSRYNDHLNLFRNISDKHQYIKSTLLETSILNHFYNIIELLMKAQSKLDIPLQVHNLSLYMSREIVTFSPISPLMPSIPCSPCRREIQCA